MPEAAIVSTALSTDPTENEADITLEPMILDVDIAEPRGATDSLRSPLTVGRSSS